MGLKSALFLLIQVIAVYCQSPECQLTDSKCLKGKSQTLVPVIVGGLPELGGEKLDPMHVEQIKVDLSGLKLNLKNAQITGLNTAVIDKLSIDPAKKQIKLIFHADYALKSKYKASGRLLILPISGDGDADMRLKNCIMQMDMVYDIVKNEQGLDTIELKSHKYTYDVKDGAVYKLTNLFNGNKPLSDAMHMFMNENWKTLSLEFGVPIFNHPIQKIFNNIKLYLKTQPISS